MKPLKVGAEFSGQRLDRALSGLEPKYSRSAWRNLIKAGHIKLNGQLSSQPAATVKAGDELTVELPTKPAERPTVPIIYQDDDVVVYDKPAGLLTHAKDDLAAEWTLGDLARPLVSGDDSNRPGIVHRLDRATSGVIIVARRPEVKLWLQRQFAGRKVKKTYLAIVRGQLAQSRLTIDLPLKRDATKPGTFSVNPAGRPAVTELSVLKTGHRATLLELRPLTGRTHQLRVHLSHAGHPIIGDDLYGSQPDQSAERLYLHASRLELTLPGGANRLFQAELPADFKRGLERYGLD